MNLRTRLLYIACALAATVTLSSCGNQKSGTKAAANKPKPAASSQAPTGVTGVDSSQGSNSLADAWNPSAGSSAPNPFDLGNGSAAAPGAGLSMGKPAPIPVKPLSASVRPEPKQLLLLVQNAYRTAKTMSVAGTTRVTMKQDGKVVASPPAQKFSTTYKQPGKFVMVVPEGNLFCDGKSVINYSSLAKRYNKLPLSKEFVQGLIYSRPGVGMMGLVFGMDYSAGVASSKLLADANVAGQDTFVLQLHFKKGVGGSPNTDVTQTLWIGKQDLTIYKNQAVAIVKPIAPKGFKGKVPKSMETTIVSTISKSKSNAPIADSAFVFKAPVGAKPIERTQMPKSAGVDIIGKPAPDFAFTAPDGSSKKLSDLEGKPVLLIFWALPMPKQQFDYLKSACSVDKSTAEVVAINVNGQGDKVRSFLKEQGVSLPLIFANQSIAKVAMQGYGLRGLPSMLIIDKSGLVRLATIGLPDAKDLAAKLKKYAPAN